MRPPMLTRGIMRSVWLLKAAPSPGAGAAVQVPTQCGVSIGAIDASLTHSGGSRLFRVGEKLRDPGAMLRASPAREVAHGGIPDHRVQEAHARFAEGRRGVRL